MAKPALFLDAETAAQRLGVSKATLYAYVSRGLIQASDAEADPRRRQYSAHDVDALCKRKSVGRRPKAAAQATLDWGLPVLTSAITLIDGNRLFYRGQDAALLSDAATLEEVACLLWDCGMKDPFADPAALPAPLASVPPTFDDLPLIERLQALLPLFAAGRAIAWQRDPKKLWIGAAALLRAITAIASRSQPGDQPVHRHLAKAWQLDARGADLVRRALVLLADHELNASAFAVRVVASTGASLGACLSAGLSALSGPLHGGTTSLVELLFSEMDARGDAQSVIEERLRRGDGVPGFGHPLYPQGDPRARAILDHLPLTKVSRDLIAAMEETSGRLPDIDFALVALRRELGLPIGTALALFAIGRTVGWLAHALEQAGTGRLIRPRAQYNGPLPTEHRSAS
ncbi:citrate synthase [Rhizobium rhizosphaerae]|uniref:citrate synthase (unknown stereospecificity) n=1 Tax=Xaviernesmea rhizosphaerae TaxID=1672749 RepID=A0ABX3PFF9_9HYPH|nr:citrate synthase family protein [Xaviernesmea rhizosphaerae]OQP86910.1 citrate synthase [Xaviernesmea rhizosphaerae]